MNIDNLSFDQFADLHKAQRVILSRFPQEHAIQDIHRISMARNAFQAFQGGRTPSVTEEKSYFVKSIKPRNALEITREEFDLLQKTYGGSISKIALIDSGLTDWLKSGSHESSLLSTGGACALESIDTKILQHFSRQKNRDNLMKEYVEGMFSRFPTWTQIAGAIIPTSGVSVMYDETFPWHLRIKEYGIADPEVMTQGVYDNIYEAVQRFVRLHDPNSKVVKIPFSSLQLDTEGYFDQWYKETQVYLRELEDVYKLDHIQYNPESFYKYWLEYTYFGPKILEINKKLIKKNYPELYDEHHIENASIHVRGKQIDHLDVERVNLWMHKVILGKAKKTKRLNTLLAHPFQRLGVALYSWRRDNYDKYSSIGFAGMTDFNYCGRVAHEDGVYAKSELRSLTTGSELNPTLLDSPLRLHSKNINQVVLFLERFKSPNAVSFSKDTLISLTQTRGKLEQVEAKIATLHEFIDAFSLGERLFTAILDEQYVLEGCEGEKSCEEILDRLFLRMKGDKDIINYVKINLGEKRADTIIRGFFDAITFTKKGTAIHVTTPTIEQEFVKTLQYICHHRKIQDMKRCELMFEEKKQTDQKLKEMFSKVTEDISQHQSDNLTEHVNILPLASNMFVSYMQQLLFVPSIRTAYLHLAEIESNSALSTQEKEEAVIDVIQKIFPIVTKCLVYVLAGGDYPWKERFEFQYE